MYPLGHENIFLKKKYCYTSAQCYKRRTVLSPSEATHFFLKERYIIFFLCTDRLCIPNVKVQMTFWFIAEMLMMKMTCQWRCLAYSTYNSQFDFRRPVQQEIREESHVGWGPTVWRALCCTQWLPQGYKMSTGVPVLCLRKYRKYRLRGELVQITQLPTRARIWTQFYLTLNHVESMY